MTPRSSRTRRPRSLKSLYALLLLAMASANQTGSGGGGLFQRVAAAVSNGNNNRKVHNATSDGDGKNRSTSSDRVRSEDDSNFETSSQKSWIDGMEFESYDADADSKHGSDATYCQPEAEGPPLRIPCGIILPTVSARGDDDIKNNHSNIRPVQAIVDTGFAQTILSRSKAKEIGLLSRMVKHGRNEAKEPWGTSLGRVPARTDGSVTRTILFRMGSVEATVPAPTIVVAKALPPMVPESVDLVIGLDFLRAYESIIDLRGQVIRMVNVDGVEVTVPLIRFRGEASRSLAVDSCGRKGS